MDQKGQISIEFVLVVALMLVIVLLVGSYTGEQNEINTVTAAARTGAMDAATDLALLNRNMEPLRINDVRMNGSGQNLTLLINVSGPVLDNTNRTLFNATIRSIAALGYTIDTRNLTDYFDDVVVTGRHTYGVVIV
jgi:uncharacterized protein (UPF0333 family)